MPEFLTQSFANGPHVAPLEVLARLLVALLLGGVISAVYRYTRRVDIGLSFPATLVLLCVLIAMVTQVIGDNVARAFSLVGALSIVRFRTVVRDTQDTAYVIFAVTVGMAVGARSLWVASIGIGVIALAELAFWLRNRSKAAPEHEFLLNIRAAAHHDMEALVSRGIGERIDSRELLQIGTGKQGASYEATYRIRPRAGISALEIVRALNVTEGVQSVQLTRRDFEES